MERGLAANTLSSYRRDLRRYAAYLDAQGIGGLDEINRRVRTAVAAGDKSPSSILTDPLGPLWYRGLITRGAAFEQEVAAAAAAALGSSAACSDNRTGGSSGGDYELPTYQPAPDLDIQPYFSSDTPGMEDVYTEPVKTFFKSVEREPGSGGSV